MGLGLGLSLMGQYGRPNLALAGLLVKNSNCTWVGLQERSEEAERGRLNLFDWSRENWMSGVRGRQSLGLLPVPVHERPVGRRAQGRQVLGVGRKRHRPELVRSQLRRRQNLPLTQRLHACTQLDTITDSSIVFARWRLCTWAEEVWGRQKGPAPSNTFVGPFMLLSPPSKMLNQPLVSPLTLAMTENY